MFKNGKDAGIIEAIREQSHVSGAKQKLALDFVLRLSRRMDSTTDNQIMNLVTVDMSALWALLSD